MKYKIGDKVKIKTWKDMQRKYGITDRGYINIHYEFTNIMEGNITNLNNGRIVTIKEVCYDDFYKIKENDICILMDDMIECLDNEYKKQDPILSRFEILDL